MTVKIHRQRRDDIISILCSFQGGDSKTVPGAAALKANLLDSAVKGRRYSSLLHERSWAAAMKYLYKLLFC